MNKRIILLSISAILALTGIAVGQRDNFTEEEIELVRNAQEIDRRIDVLTRAIDRRFEVLKMDVAAPRSSSKKSEEWGPMPQGTRLELLYDIKRILQKAIDDIDSLAERPDSIVIGEPEKGKKPKTYDDLFPKAVRTLAAAAARYRPALKMELDRENSNAEKGSVLDALDMCTQIIDAAAKLPTEIKPERKKN